MKIYFENQELKWELYPDCPKRKMQSITKFLKNYSLTNEKVNWKEI